MRNGGISDQIYELKQYLSEFSNIVLFIINILQYHIIQITIDLRNLLRVQEMKKLMTSMNEFIELLEKLEEKGIFYKLSKSRIHTIMIEVSVPGQRWEIEYNTYGESKKCQIEIEKFVSNGALYDETELKTLFKDFSD